MDPELILFEMQVCPSEFRFAIAPGQPLVFGYMTVASARPLTAILPYEGNEARFESLLESLHWLLVANNVLGSPQHEPKQAFVSKVMNDLSVHLRLEYSDGKKWASRYPFAELPENLQTLLEQSKYLGQQELKDDIPAPKSPPTKDDIVFERDAGLGTPLAKIKVTASGQMEMSGVAMSPATMFEALRVLKNKKGEVRLHVEEANEMSLLPVREASKYLKETAKLLGLPLTESAEGFD